MRKFRLLFLLFALHLPGHLPAMDIYSSINGVAYTEPLAYSEFARDWDGPLQGGKHALQHIEAKLGARFDSWGVELVRRDDGDARFSASTAEFYHAITNKLPLDAGRSYDVNLRVNHATLSGARAFRMLDLQPWLRLEYGLSVYKADNLVSGTLRGDINALSTKDYSSGTVVVDYYYSRDTLFDRDVDAPTGWGYAFDFTANASPTPELALRLKLENVMGHIFWSDAPYTEALIDTNNKSYDANGYVVVLPVLSGKHGYRDFTQDMPLLGEFGARLHVASEVVLTGQWYATPYKSFFSYGGAILFGTGIELGTMYTVDIKQLAILLKTRAAFIELGADAVPIDSARSLRIAAGINMNFDP